MKKLILTICFSVAYLISMAQSSNTIRYVALGDSYTICEGVNTSECWPNVLTKHLNKKDVDITLVANPSKTGYTSQQLIDNEMAVFTNAEANFATVLIGVNDWVQGVQIGIFESNLNYIVETLLETLSSDRLFLITIPDFSATPKGPEYSKGRDITSGISEFNEIIKKAGDMYGVSVIDIFPTTQAMKDNPELVSADGLHPSAKEYLLWEGIIYPHVYEALKPR
jgi:acyl-CoA thioesterase I